MPSPDNKKTVLIVEDELDMRIFLATLLKTNGLTPIIAKDGRDGIQKARNAHPELIILDMMMPEEGGALMYKHLKTDDALKHIPVIILSGVSRKTFYHYVKILSAGINEEIPPPDAYIEKPPDARHLLGIIQELI